MSKKEDIIEDAIVEETTAIESTEGETVIQKYGKKIAKGAILAVTGIGLFALGKALGSRSKADSDDTFLSFDDGE